MNMDSYISLDGLVFTEHPNPQRSGLGMNVRGYWVEIHIFELTKKLINASFDQLPCDKKLEVSDICSDLNWNNWKYGLRLKIGRCLKHFVDQGMLNLTLMNSGKKGPRRYMRK